MWSETITKTVLENCLRVTIMPSPSSRTVSLGLFVDHGGKDEDLTSSGISHFIEHLVFNPNRMEPATQKLLGSLLDSGSSYEAFTGKEFTRSTITCRRDDLGAAISCLSGILRSPRVLPEDVEHERSIILQEFDTYISSGRVKDELVEQALWGDRSLGLFVIGRRDNILSFRRDELTERLHKYYAPHNTQLVILGNVDADEVNDLVYKNFSRWTDNPVMQQPVLIEEEPNIIGLPSNGGRAEITLAFLGPSFGSGDRHALYLLGDVLGGTVKSRLFQEVRERRQLCYAIYAYTVTYRLGGYLAISVNTRLDQVDEVYRAIMEVINDLKERPIPEEELDRARAARITGMLELPSDARRHLQTLGRFAILGRDFFVDWECSELRRVTPDDLLNLARKMFRPERLAITGLGVKGEQLLGLL